jgi:hypothetical protein
VGKQREFFILDTRHRGDQLLWWRPDNSGYTIYLEAAGRYTEEQVRSNLSYYENGETRAIPCEDVLACKEKGTVVDASMRYGLLNGRGKQVTT